MATLVSQWMKEICFLFILDLILTFEKERHRIKFCLIILICWFMLQNLCSFIYLHFPGLFCWFNCFKVHFLVRWGKKYSNKSKMLETLFDSVEECLEEFEVPVLGKLISLGMLFIFLINWHFVCILKDWFLPG